MIDKRVSGFIKPLLYPTPMYTIMVYDGSGFESMRLLTAKTMTGLIDFILNNKPDIKRNT